MVTRRDRTHARLLETALDLFEAQGFDQTTVGQIAAAAGVTEMTFFRHFPSKDLVVLVDPYDPVIASAVAAQPRGQVALHRVAGGVRAALSGLTEPESALVRCRVRVIAGSTTLRARSAGMNVGTETSIADQLIADGATPLAARAAAAAALAALTSALFEWARQEQLPLASAIEGALRALEGRDD